MIHISNQETCTSVSSVAWKQPSSFPLLNVVPHRMAVAQELQHLVQQQQQQLQSQGTASTAEAAVAKALAKLSQQGLPLVTAKGLAQQADLQQHVNAHGFTDLVSCQRGTTLTSSTRVSYQWYMNSQV